MRTNDEPLIETASPAEIIAAIEALDLEAPWPEIAGDLRPALPRQRDLPEDAAEMVSRELPPGILVGLGLDIGPAMLFVPEFQLDRWNVTADQAFEQALDNVRARVAARRHFGLVRDTIMDTPTTAFQSHEGWAASLLLLPTELERVFGTADSLFLAPMRDVLIGMPIDADPAVALGLLEEFAAVDMNALDVPIVARIGGELHLTLAVSLPNEGGRQMH